MDIFISFVIPALLLAYYLKTMLPEANNKSVIVGMLAGGTILFYLGVLFDMMNPAVASIFKLAGACLFFTCVAINSRRPVKKAPDDGSDGNENSE